MIRWRFYRTVLTFLGLIGLISFIAPVSHAANCASPAAIEGAIVYNSSESVLQYCNGANWQALGAFSAGGGGGPTGCPTIGDVCSDGSVYAGLSPDGNVPMYTTPADAGQHTWNNGGFTYIDTAMSNTSYIPGEANTVLLVGLSNGDSPYAAAVYCDNLESHGKGDWYLPARDELDVLYTNNAAIGGFDTSGTPLVSWYWTSSEYDNGSAYFTVFSTGAHSWGGKAGNNNMRCVRKEGGGGSGPSGGPCTNPTAPEGTIVYNADSKVPQYCSGDWFGLSEPQASGYICAGDSWSSQTAAELNGWQNVTYGGGLFVATSGSGTNRVMTSPDGIDWTARSAAEANNWYAVTYSGGLYVAVAGSGTNRVMTSPDAINWTARSAAEANTWRSVTYGDGLFVAVSSGGTNRVMTSPDGINWTARSAAEANLWTDVVYGDGLFVAISLTGTNRVMTSPDGINWTARSAAENNAWNSVTYGNGMYVAVATSGTNRVMTSPDGINWTARSAAEANLWTGVTYGDGLFVATSIDGTNRVMTSSDGINWTGQTAAESQQWLYPAYGDGTFVAVGNSGSNRVMTSECSGGGGGSCSNPSAPEGTILYNNTYNIHQYCDGTNWIAFELATP